MSKIRHTNCRLERFEKIIEEDLEEFLRNNAFPLYDLYGHAPAQEPLSRGSFKFQL